MEVLEQSDIVWGTKNIAKEVNRTERQTHHLLSTGQLPAKKVGDRWVGSRKKLRTYLVDETV